MQSPAPFLSIIIPTHKRPALLERALKSIKLQECPFPYEVIVISDAADFASDEVCFRLLGKNDMVIRRNGAPGPSQSRNLGISVSSGRYLMFLDDDDAWSPDLLVRLASLDEVRKDEFLYFDCSVVTESRTNPKFDVTAEDKIELRNNLNELVFVKNQVHMSCFAFPRRLLGNTRFDPHMRAYEDWDFQLAMFEKEMPRHIPIQGSIVFEVRDETTDRRGSSTDATNFNAVLDYLYVYRRRPAPSEMVRQQRTNLLQQVGMIVPAEVL